MNTLIGAATLLSAGFIASQAASWYWEEKFHYPLETPPAADSRLDWGTFLSGPKFDQDTYGQLLAVYIQLWVEFEMTLEAENTDQQPRTITFDFAGNVDLKGPDSVLFATATLNFQDSFSASAYDGILDYGGTSGKTWPAIRPSSSSWYYSTSQPVLNLFIGSGSVTMSAEAGSSVQMAGSPNMSYEVDSFAGAKVRVTYIYVPEPNGWLLTAPALLGITIGRRFALWNRNRSKPPKSASAA